MLKLLVQAVVFFETSKANNAGDLNHIYVWQDFDVPSVQTIVQLRDMLAIDVVDFQAKYGLNQGKLVFFSYHLAVNSCRMYNMFFINTAI